MATMDVFSMTDRLSEAARLVRPEGAIGVFDEDFASLSFEAESAQDAAENDTRLVRSVATQPRVMRRMPRLARHPRLSVERSFAHLWIGAQK